MPKPSKRNGSSSQSALIFSPTNYLLLLGSVLLIVGGFVAMYLDGQFLGTVSLSVSPVIIVTGYVLLIYAILRRPDEEAVAEDA